MLFLFLINHVNHTNDATRIGVLLCINGTGILNTWIKNNIAYENITYEEMNQLAEAVPIGSDGACIVPFGNGAERVLKNQELNCSIHGIKFNSTSKAHLIRAAQEGIAFAFKYGIDILIDMGIAIKVIRAGYANMFLSPVFRQTLANVTGATIELYNTDGSVGAAHGAGIGSEVFKNEQDAFSCLKNISNTTPDLPSVSATKDAYHDWKIYVEKQLAT